MMLALLHYKPRHKKIQHAGIKLINQQPKMLRAPQLEPACMFLGKHLEWAVCMTAFLVNSSA